MTNDRVRRVQDLRRSNAARPIPRRRRERTLAEELAELGEDDLMVCRTHRRFVPCRGRGGCDLSAAPSDVEAVRRYQQGP